MNLLAALSLVACQKPVPVTAEGAPSPLVPSVLAVTIGGPEGQRSVEYGLDGFDQSTPATSDDLVSVLGLKAGQTYRWRAVVVDERGDRQESAPSTFDVPAAPDLLQGVQVTTSEDDAQLRYFLGATIFEAKERSYAAILDRDGDWVWWVEATRALGDGTVLEQIIETPELGNDGRSLVWSQYDFDKFGDDGILVRVSLDGQRRTETRLYTGHHDFVQHDDGTIAFLGMEAKTFSIGGDDYYMGSDVIYSRPEGDLSEGEPDRVFSMFDSFPLHPAVTCGHIADKDQKVGFADVYEWTHGNSLMYLPETDAYYLNDKFTDWLTKIDRSSGQIAWFMNGRDRDLGEEPPASPPHFTQPNGDPIWTYVSEDVHDTSLWSHGHMSQIWDGGGMMYDNGDHHDPPLSHAIEFAWDESTMTAWKVWDYPEPHGDAGAALGDVHKLPGGDVLITWSSDIDRVTEVTYDDQRVVWEASMPSQVGRLVPLDDLYFP
jgi:hypothetical protein